MYIRLVEPFIGVCSLQGCLVRREIPVFGAPFGFGVFIIGVIDEIRVDQETFNFDLLEFKTRSVSRSLPSKAQKCVHSLQVNLNYIYVHTYINIYSLLIHSSASIIPFKT